VKESLQGPLNVCLPNSVK